MRKLLKLGLLLLPVGLASGVGIVAYRAGYQTGGHDVASLYEALRPVQVEENNRHSDS